MRHWYANLRPLATHGRAGSGMTAHMIVNRLTEYKSYGGPRWCSTQQSALENDACLAHPRRLNTMTSRLGLGGPAARLRRARSAVKEDVRCIASTKRVLRNLPANGRICVLQRQNIRRRSVDPVGPGNTHDDLLQIRTGCGRALLSPWMRSGTMRRMSSYEEVAIKAAVALQDDYSSGFFPASSPAAV